MMMTLMRRCRKIYASANSFVELHHVVIYCLVIMIVGFLTFMESFATPCHNLNPSLTNKGVNTWRHVEDQSGLTDDQLLQYLYYNETQTADLWNVTGAVACIVICIPAVLDTILDLLPTKVMNLFYSDERPQWKPISTEILRFTHLERLIMVAGIIINPIQTINLAFSPTTESASNMIMLRKEAHLLAVCAMIIITFKPYLSSLLSALVYPESLPCSFYSFSLYYHLLLSL